MGPIARVLWESLPELCHVGAVLAVIALMVAIMGLALFGDRAASFSSLAGMLCLLFFQSMFLAVSCVLIDEQLSVLPVSQVSIVTWLAGMSSAAA